MARLRTTPFPQQVQAQPQQVLVPTWADPSPPLPPAANAGQYTYAVEFTAVPAAGQSQTQSLTIDNDADFDWMYSTYIAWAGTVGNQDRSSQLVPAASVLISTQDTQKLSNIPVPIAALFGDGFQPMVLPRARRLSRRTVLTFQVVNNDPSDTLTMTLALIGQKVYSRAN